ncbi:MAG: helix-turn-helix domain-containing protein [Candidatus Bathyarchaeota archaeon]|nr:helix-turn-helix domain-containing protein [Candidatus Bathyarchaeota archaeon]
MSKQKNQSKNKVSPKLKVKLNFKGVRANIVPILQLLAAGRYSAEIARMLKMSKPHVAYYTNILEKVGFIHRERRSSSVCYIVTDEGKNFLDRAEGVLVGSKIWRLHNAKYRYGLLQDGVWPSEWRKVELINWTALLGLEGGVNVQHTPSSVIINVDALYGENPSMLQDTAKTIADRTAKALMQKYHCLLQEGQLCRKPHFAIDDPVAEFVSRYFEISTPEAKIDRSKGLGEIDYFGTKNAVDYLRMPEQVNAIEEKVESLNLELKEMHASIEQIIELLNRRCGEKVTQETVF